MKILNAKQTPKVFFGLHMCEGVAQYDEQNGKSSRILVLENALKEMDPTFAGKPVYVHHVDKVNLETIQNEADGYVVRSFFNPADGKHWTQFIVVSDAGHEAISQKWKLSNAYVIKDSRGGGKWHNVDYQMEVMRGEYEHLAIVPNPRYEESIILTPEEFKLYNSEKEQELLRLANSKEKNSMGLNLFRKNKVDNAKDFEEVMVTLASGRELTLKQVVNELEELEKKKENEEEASGQEVMANGDHMVDLGGDKKLKVNELVKAYQELMAKQAEGDEAAKKKALEEAEMKKNEEAAKAEEEKKQNALKAEEARKTEAAKAEGMKTFEALRNAAQAAPTVLETSSDQLARGRARYGSRN